MKRPIQRVGEKIIPATVDSQNPTVKMHSYNQRRTTLFAGLLESDKALRETGNTSVVCSFCSLAIRLECPVEIGCHRKVTPVSNNSLIFGEAKEIERTNSVLNSTSQEGRFHGCETGPVSGLCQVHKQLKGLILAQNERWRRGLGMQVAREPARGTAANGVGIVGDVPSGRG